MNNCKICGAEIEIDQRYCNNCVIDRSKELADSDGRRKHEETLEEMLEKIFGFKKPERGVR